MSGVVRSYYNENKDEVFNDKMPLTMTKNVKKLTSIVLIALVQKQFEYFFYISFVFFAYISYISFSRFSRDVAYNKLYSIYC